ncbi:MAG TPA: HAD family hydrolase [Sedimentisphaerales bacterium]|nr:HAD family hydrolase [Sedimentisphaerales bacterium]
MQENRPEIKAVLFDLGETLLTFGRVKATELFRQGARLSYEYLKSCGQRVGNFEYYFWRNLIALRIRHLISNVTQNDFNSSALLRGIGKKRGIALDRHQWEQFSWLWYEPLSKIAMVEPDIKQTLAKLKGLGLKLGIVSNTFVNGHSIERHLEQVGILEFFPVRLYSYQYDFRKPNHQLFRIAAEHVGEAPQHIAYVGDRINKDILPALKLGMTAILKAAYTNAGQSPPYGAHKITHLSELPTLVQNINAPKTS